MSKWSTEGARGQAILAGSASGTLGRVGKGWAWHGGGEVTLRWLHWSERRLRERSLGFSNNTPRHVGEIEEQDSKLGASGSSVHGKGEGAEGMSVKTNVNQRGHDKGTRGRDRGQSKATPTLELSCKERRPRLQAVCRPKKGIQQFSGGGELSSPSPCQIMIGQVGRRIGLSACVAWHLVVGCKHESGEEEGRESEPTRPDPQS